MSNPKDYTVGWICAIATECVAAQACLDAKHEGPEYVSPNDNNDYTLGKVGKHNVVIAVLPEGEYGISSAASVARDMLYSFPNIRIGLMVGIGGGAPSLEHDIRLGDIVVSAPRDGKGGVFQYDFGKTIQNQSFQPTGFLNQPPIVLRTAVNGLKAQYEGEGHQLEEAINGILEKKSRLRKKYQRPDPSKDRLYQTGVTHPLNDEASCVAVCGDNPLNLIPRRKRAEDEDNPAIHYGLIASANQLMKDALLRDKFAKENSVLCFEMEAAGLMNQFPCLVVRGICDYSDTHKNKEWQGYAAMAAAAYTKDLLCRIPPNKVEAEKRIGDILSSVQGGVDKLIHMQHDQQQEAILNWLTPIDYAPQQSTLTSRWQPGTGQWFLDSPEFQAWLKTSNKTLFCPGFPGAGKTFITSIVVYYLQTNYQKDSEQNSNDQNDKTGIAFIYCDFQRQHEQKPVDILASLIKQLIQGQPSVPDRVKRFYAKHKKSPSSSCSISDFSEALQYVLSDYNYTRIFIVIDALDECQDQSTLMSEIFKLQARTGANLFTTSRPIQEIKKEFEGSILEISARDEDVEKYLDGQISQLPLLAEKNQDLTKEIKIEIKTKIKAKIIKAVNGVFLLARLHLDSLIDKTTPNKITAALETLPKGPYALGEVYGKTIERIRSQRPGFQRLAESVLLLITCGKRLLTTLELRHALAVKAGRPTLDGNDLESTSVIVSVCAGLVTVDEESDIIHLLHNTTREYLETHMFCLISREDPTMYDAEKNDIAMANAQKTITIICVTYLLFNTFETGFCPTPEGFKARLQLYPVYNYAAQNWGYHARAASAGVEQLTTEFLENEAKVSASSQAMMAWDPTQPTRVTGVHLAAYFGLREAMAALLKNGVDINSKDYWGRTALSWAAKKGHEAVVKLLLAKDGVDLNSKDYWGGTALSWAARKGHEAVVKLLLATERVDLVPWYGRALSLAAAGGHEAVVKLLLAKDGVDLNSKDLNGRTALSLAAALKGNEAVVKLLLAKDGVDLNSKDLNGRTALSLAAALGNEAVVKLLRQSI